MAYTLVTERVSTDMLEAAAAIHEEARGGRALGMVSAVMLRRKRFIVVCAGEAKNSPTFARGMVASIDDYLRELTHAKSFEET